MFGQGHGPEKPLCALRMASNIFSCLRFSLDPRPRLSSELKMSRAYFLRRLRVSFSAPSNLVRVPTIVGRLHRSTNGSKHNSVPLTTPRPIEAILKSLSTKHVLYLYATRVTALYYPHPMPHQKPMSALSPVEGSSASTTKCSAQERVPTVPPPAFPTVCFVEDRAPLLLIAEVLTPKRTLGHDHTRYRSNATGGGGSFVVAGETYQ